MFALLFIVPASGLGSGQSISASLPLSTRLINFSFFNLPRIRWEILLDPHQLKSSSRSTFSLKMIKAESKEWPIRERGKKEREEAERREITTHGFHNSNEMTLAGVE